MYAPPTLDFYPELIMHGPLANTIAKLRRALYGPRADRDRAKRYFEEYSLKRRQLLSRFLAGNGYAWCGLCGKLVVSSHVQTVFRHGTYTRMKTDCSYGPPFPSVETMAEVMDVCFLHGEVFDDDTELYLAPVTAIKGRLMASIDGQNKDVTSYDRRTDPPDDSLMHIGLFEALAQEVPPELEVTWYQKPPELRMAGNPYVTLEQTW